MKLIIFHTSRTLESANMGCFFLKLKIQPLPARGKQVLTSSRGIDQDLNYTLEAFVKHIVVGTIEFIEDPFKAGLEQQVSTKFPFLPIFCNPYV